MSHDAERNKSTSKATSYEKSWVWVRFAAMWGYLIQTFKNPYKTLSKPAFTLKVLLQMIVGGALIFSMLLYVYGKIDNTKSIDAIWECIKSEVILGMIGDALLISTGIELGYMLFTDGPDEAVAPLVTAVAAVILLRIPTNPIKDMQIGLERALEVGIYIVILTLLLRLRKHYVEKINENT